jgi:UDP-N-acetylmuramyl pentapeptide phosphotransferase/UDP-N-acetylglucosamine-1-phosphate transferase
MPPGGFLAPGAQSRAAPCSFRLSGEPCGGLAMIALALAAVVSAAVLALLAHRPGLAPRDLPNARSLHERPVPRAGGWAVWAGFFAVALWLPPPPGFAGAAHAALLASIAALFGISLVDDFRGVAAVWRMAVQVACALATAVVLVPTTEVLVIALVAFVLVAATNFYNFMDGSDGLAGAMTVVGFATLAFGAALDRTASFMPLAALAVATLPFLVRNLPPAHVFLGDAGAAPLGFFAAAASIGGVVAGAWDAWFPILVFLPFEADAIVTLSRRLLRRERIWEAHRVHYYQRLVRLGAGHGGTLAAFGALMLGCAATALACLALAPAAGPVALTGWVAGIALLFAGIDYHWRHRA